MIFAERLNSAEQIAIRQPMSNIIIIHHTVAVCSLQAISELFDGLFIIIYVANPFSVLSSPEEVKRSAVSVLRKINFVRLFVHRVLFSSCLSVRERNYTKNFPAISVKPCMIRPIGY